MSDEAVTAAPDTEADAEVSPVAEAVPAPAAVEDTAPEPPSEPVLARSRLGARLPFWILGGVWAIFAGVMTYLLWAASTGPFTSHPLYAVFIYGGVGLTVTGPLLAVAVWLLLRRTSEPALREGLVRAVLLRAAVATVCGNVLWWVVLVALDLHRSGVLG